MKKKEVSEDNLNKNELSFSKEIAETLGIESAIILSLYKDNKLDDISSKQGLLESVKKNISFIDDQTINSCLTKLIRFPCSDALSYCQLCEGKLNVVLQCYNKIWDIHPLIPLIKNAGGFISTWKGKDAKFAGSIVASSSKILQKKILNMLKPVA